MTKLFNVISEGTLDDMLSELFGNMSDEEKQGFGTEEAQQLIDDQSEDIPDSDLEGEDSGTLSREADIDPSDLEEEDSGIQLEADPQDTEGAETDEVPISFIPTITQLRNMIETKPEKFQKFSSLLARHNHRILSPESLNTIDFTNWNQDDIKSYNASIIDIINSFLMGRTKTAVEVTPFAMAQVDKNLWPDVPFKKGDSTTIRDAINKLLPDSDPLAWTIEKNYGVLKRLYDETKTWYANNQQDMGIQLNKLKFMKQYFEHNSRTSSFFKDSELCLLKLISEDGEVSYVPFLYSQWVRANNARKRGKPALVNINGEEFEAEMVDVGTIEIKPPITFSSKQNKRRFTDKNFNIKDFNNPLYDVGGLNNAIFHLFDDVTDENANLEVIAKLGEPIEQYKTLAKEYGTYIPNWDDSLLLRLARMFISVLKQASPELSPNLEEWESNWANSVEYPLGTNMGGDELHRMAPSKKQDRTLLYVITTGIDNLTDTVAQAKEKLAQSEEIEPEVTSEGIVTTPSIIVINGNPFQLDFGDRLIIDNIKRNNSRQK